jgi:RNA polymerase sigma factor (sigma-70 family)
MTEGSITGWYNSLQRGNQAAAAQLWERFAQRLIHLARLRLRPGRHQGADEEDAVLSAFDSFCRAAEQGKFPDLHDRDGLWQLLVAITLRKVSDQIVHERRQKRGGGAVLRETDLAGSGSSLEEIMSREPTPQMAAEMTEQCQRLLNLLDDDELRAIALAKLEGYTDYEVAERLGCARSTVQRRLKLIRSLWEAE